MTIRTVRILVCGETGVGKSAICNHLFFNRFVADFDPTIGDSYRKKLTINNEDCIIDAYDMATLEVDEEYYWAGNSRTYQYNDGIILVYSISNRKSFEELKKWKENIVYLKQRSHGDVKYPFFIVGNKCDLEESREVSTEEGEAAAAEFGFPFFETSAKSGINIQELFIEFAKWHFQSKIVVKTIVKKKPSKNCHLM